MRVFKRGVCRGLAGEAGSPGVPAISDRAAQHAPRPLLQEYETLWVAGFTHTPGWPLPDAETRLGHAFYHSIPAGSPPSSLVRRLYPQFLAGLDRHRPLSRGG